MALIAFALISTGIFLISNIRASTPATAIGDVNADGDVNLFDLSALLAHWNMNFPAGDFNGDNSVTVLDLSMLLSHWGRTVTPAPTASPSATPSPSPTGSGFVGRSGTNLMLDGQRFRFIGFNAYGMTGCNTGAPWTIAQLDTYFSNLPANGLTRLWAFKYYGTAKIQTIVTEAAKYHQHLILSLGDDDGACNESDGSPGGPHAGKTLAFYQTGWKGQYLTWVNTIVPMFMSSPTVAMWEIANEPGQFGAHPDITTMKTYLDGAAAAIKARDRNHLVGTGANYEGNFGGSANYVTAHSGPDIDVISFHDYAWEFENKAVISSHFATAKAASTQLNKPFIAGEAGVRSGASCTTTISLAARNTYLKQKADNYLSNGASGIAFWDYEPNPIPPAGPCRYDMNPGDPILATVKNYVLP